MSERPWRQVVTGYGPAIGAMTDHLVELGHRRVGFISGPADNLSSRKRREAFEQALARHGLALRPEWTATGAFTFESGVVAARALRMAVDREVEAVDGTILHVRASSICVHGDTPDSLEIASAVRARMRVSSCCTSRANVDSAWIATGVYVGLLYSLNDPLCSV